MSLDPSFNILGEGIISKLFNKGEYSCKPFSLKFGNALVESTYQTHLRGPFLFIQKISIIHILIAFTMLIGTAAHQLISYKSGLQRDKLLLSIYTLTALLCTSVAHYYLSRRYIRVSMIFGVIQTILIVIGLTEVALIEFDVAKQFETSSLAMQIIAGISVVCFD